MKYDIRRRSIAVALVVTALFAGACGKEEGKEKGGGEAREAEHAESHEEGSAAKPTGKVIVVEAYSDAVGNYFKPNEFEAHRGDIIRFTLKSGVHNVHFLADSNPGKSGLPAASDMLQLPDQTYDVPVNFAEGRYYFQCDPHAALGMKGHVKVED
jgi:plastocyanin